MRLRSGGDCSAQVVSVGANSGVEPGDFAVEAAGKELLVVRSFEVLACYAAESRFSRREPAWMTVRRRLRVR